MQKEVKEMYQSRVFGKLESFPANPFTKEGCIFNVTLKISLTCCREVNNVFHFAVKNSLFSVTINNSL